MEDRGLSSQLLGDPPFEQASSYTLPQHPSSPLALPHQLDCAWFYDNHLKPCIPLFDVFVPSSLSSRLLSPSPSIELMDAAHSKWISSSSSHNHGRVQLPCARIEPASPGIAGAAVVSSGHVKEPLQTACRIFSLCNVCSKPPVDTVLAPSGMLQAGVLNGFRTSKEIRATKKIPGTPKLESIESGKELQVSPPPPELFGMRAPRKNRRRYSKSMTALEYDELQGIMDLGFQFGQDDLTPRIVTMFPALKYKARDDTELGKGMRAMVGTKQRKSAHEAWLLHRSAAPLHMHLQIPARSEDMKEHLKFWARAVASTVRQEC